MKKRKQISYISALIIIIGSTIGAGIFFKNGELFNQAHGNLWLVISSWTVAGIGMVALGLAIVEVVSASKTNKGVIEWFENFMPKWVAKSSKSYLQLIYIPLTMFTMPLYVVSSFQDAGWDISGGIVLLMGIAIFLWIAGISYISLKASERTQWVITLIKFVPLVILPLIAFAHSPDLDGSVTHKVNTGHKTGLLGVAPAIVIIGGIPAIAFAFDGFYEVTSIRNDLKNPKKLGSLIAVGVSIILAAYLFLTIAFAFGSNDGNHGGIFTDSGFFSDKSWALKMFNILIGIGIIGIVNGYMMGSLEQNVSLYKSGDSPAMSIFQKGLAKINIKVTDIKKLSFWFIVISSLLPFLIFGLIGIFGYSENEYTSYGHSSAGKLYTFADVIVNYSSSLVFGLIALSIIGAMFNRFTNKIKVNKKKYFWPAAIIGVTIILSGVIFQFISGFVNLSGYNGASVGDSILKLSIFAGIIIISIITGVLELKYWDKNTNSKIENKNINKVVQKT